MSAHKSHNFVAGPTCVCSICGCSEKSYAAAQLCPYGPELMVEVESTKFGRIQIIKTNHGETYLIFVGDQIVQSTSANGVIRWLANLIQNM